MKGGMLIGYLVVLLIATIAFAVYIVIDLGDVRMSIHGWIAMALGIVISLVLGIGLMVLTYYSHKRGYDDDAHGDS